MGWLRFRVYGLGIGGTFAHGYRRDFHSLMKSPVRDSNGFATVNVDVIRSGRGERV